MVRSKDLLWLLAYPAYQTIGTIRHEGCHALAGRLEGAQILEFVIVPRIDGRRGLLWGYVRYEGPATWLTTAAPYLGALLWFAAFLPFCLKTKGPRWLRLNLVILGVVSPLLDTAYNYVGGVFRPYNDVARLLRVLPPATVHAFFLSAIALYATTLVALLRRPIPPRPPTTPSPQSQRQ